MRKEFGGALILFVIVVPVLLIVAAVVIDYGYLIAVKSEGQAATDASALSAVAAVPNYVATGDTTKASSLAQMFNGDGPELVPATNAVMKKNPEIRFQTDVHFIQRSLEGEVVDPPPDKANGVLVKRTYDVPSFFSGFLGAASRPVQVESRALIGGPSCMPVDMPIVYMSPSCGQKSAIQDNCKGKCGVEFTVSFTSPAPDDNAAFYTIENQPSNAQHCKDLVTGKIPPDYVCIGSRIQLNNGSVTSCVQDIETQCLRHRCDEGVPWVVTFPVIHCEETKNEAGQLNQIATVRGFARVEITGVKDKANPKWIRFKLRCGDLVNGPGAGGEFCGFYSTPQLVQ